METLWLIWKLGEAYIVILLFGFLTIVFRLTQLPEKKGPRYSDPLLWKKDVLGSLLVGLNAFAITSLVLCGYIACRVSDFDSNPFSQAHTAVREEFYYLVELYLLAALARCFLPNHEVCLEAEKLGISTRKNQQYWFNAGLVVPLIGLLYIWKDGHIASWSLWLYFIATGYTTFKYLEFCYENWKLKNTRDIDFNPNKS